MRRARNASVLAALLLAACASKGPPDTSPTLKTLQGKTFEVPPDPGVPADESATIAAYGDYLKKAPHDAQRPEAMRRLGDLEMERGDSAAAQGAGIDANNYQKAVALYRDLLATYPNAPDNDRVLYQLAHAYELGGDLESSLRVLEQLLHDYPLTRFRDEAQFRRGELYFTTRNYAKAEQAYAIILNNPTHTPYFERSLYMHGWAIYKQGRLEDSLQSFFGVLDLKLIARDSETGLENVTGLTRADREMVEDTLRVTSLCLENLQGAESIPAFMGSAMRRDYEYRIYQQLGELYLSQERIKDAADAFMAFVRLHPVHAQAPALQARVIEIYRQGGFDTLVLAGKKEYVERYGIHGAFRKANPTGWAAAQPTVKGYLAELTNTYHAAAQKSKKPEDYDAAIRWYREFIESFPADPQAARQNFLLAELLFETGRFGEAAQEYEKTAYHYLPHAQAADAGYAAVLSFAEQEKRADEAHRAKFRLDGVDSALRFGYAFPNDPRTAAVLTNAAEQVYALHDLKRAPEVARLVLKLNPPAPEAQRRVAWTVIAHAAFDSGDFAEAERAYTALLPLVPEKDPARREFTERLAASVYKQAEQARAGGHDKDAVRLFERVATVAPGSPVVVTARFDAAAVLIGMKDWPAAAHALEAFRQAYPGNPLQDDVTNKLAVVYTESSRWAPAAAEYERIAARKGDAELARAALWQAAEFYDKAADAAATVRVYESYIKAYPAPLEPAIEARHRLAEAARKQGNSARVLALQKEIQQADQAGGAARTDRTRYLGATAALELAQPVYAEYQKVKLVEPLKKQLKLKKARLEDVLKAYAVAAGYGVADVATAAAFHTAELYREFGEALMASERPRGLSKDELEQYNVLLEEQAFPFEEKAIAMHEANARHSADGIYDQWVRSSYAALASLRPLRYGKTEQSEGTVDAIR